MMMSSKWTLAVVAVLAAAALTFAVPVFAHGVGFNPPAMMGGRMAEMHNAMMPLMRQMPAMHDKAIAEVAQLLGMTSDELNDALVSGSTLGELAAEKGRSLDEVQAVMTDQMKAFVDQAVADGTLTQEQADQMLQLHSEYSGSCHSGQAGGMMGGMMRGMTGGMRGMMMNPKY